MIAMFLVPLLLVGALAVDVSAHERRAQQLQNTADAAALAGATAWTAGGTAEVDLIVADIVNQNGHGHLDITIGYPAPGEVSVTVTDPSPTHLLGISPGVDELSRQATAEHRECEVACSQIINIEPPLRPIETTGTGDGFVPIIVDTRFYAINHAAGSVICIDRSTNQSCWPPRPAFDLPNVTTTTIPQTHMVGSRIYYLGIDHDPAASGELLVGCFDTATDTRCPQQHDFGTQGDGILVGTDQGLFVFTSSRRVFCFDPVAGHDCPGYAGGIATFLSGEAGWSIFDTGVNRSDYVVHGSNIYVSVETANGVYIECWDTTANSWCEPFRARLVDGTDSAGSNGSLHTRLFLARNSAGTATGVCVVGEPHITCLDLNDGLQLTSIAARLLPLQVEMQKNGSWNDRPIGDPWVGANYYHPGTNHLFTVDAEYSSTFCFDFTTSTSCGSRDHTTAFGNTLTYGYTSQGDCLIGLGHSSIFFSLKPDMSGPCDEATGTARIEQCSCSSGDPVWPIVELGTNDDMQLFNARILDPSGSIVIPATGVGWVDLLSDSIDLSEIPAHTHLTVEFEVEAVFGRDPWLAGTPPTIIVQAPNRSPQLIA